MRISLSFAALARARRAPLRALDLRGRVVAVVGDVRGDAPERGLGPVVVVVRVRGVLVGERAQVRDLCANQPVSRDVGAKLENSRARSHRSRFG